MHPACHPANILANARRLFRKDKGGGGQQCFVFLYKTNDVSQTHEPHHTSPIITTRRQHQHRQLQCHPKYNCGAHTRALPMPMPNAEESRGWSSNCPRTCASLLFFTNVYVSDLDLCCLISTMYPLHLAPGAPGPPCPGLDLVPICEVPRSARDTLHSMLSSRNKAIKPCQQRRWTMLRHLAGPMSLPKQSSKPKSQTAFGLYDACAVQKCKRV